MKGLRQGNQGETKMEFVRKIINTLDRQINNMSLGPSTRNSMAETLKKGNQGSHGKS